MHKINPKYEWIDDFSFRRDHSESFQHIITLFPSAGPLCGSCAQSPWHWQTSEWRKAIHRWWMQDLIVNTRAVALAGEGAAASSTSSSDTCSSHATLSLWPAVFLYAHETDVWISITRWFRRFFVVKKKHSHCGELSSGVGVNAFPLLRYQKIQKRFGENVW